MRIFTIYADWIAGCDPGMNVWAVMGASNAYLVAATGAESIQSWSMKAYDLTVDADLAITPDSNGSAAPGGTGVFTANFVGYNTPQLTGFWTKGGSGYNVAHYISNADFTGTPLVAGHSYMFEYTIVTPAYVTGGGGWGTFKLRRMGRCELPPPT